MYQPLVLQGLKTFFNGKKRLVRQGDLLAIKVDLNQLQYLQASLSGDGAETGVGERWVYFFLEIVQVHISQRNQGIHIPIDCGEGHLLHSHQH